MLQAAVTHKHADFDARVAFCLELLERLRPEVDAAA